MNNGDWIGWRLALGVALVVGVVAWAVVKALLADDPSDDEQIPDE